MSSEQQEALDQRLKSRNSKKKLSNYHKRQLFKMLTKTNCHPKQLEKMITRCRLDENIVKEFINTQAELSQNRLEKTLRSKNVKTFLNLDQCARNLCEQDESTSDNTLPVTLEAIANHENLPDPSKVNGIDLKALYQMLANLTAGYPIEELSDGPTKDFLKQCYTELMDSVSEIEPKKSKQLLMEQDEHTNPVYSWLCNNDYGQYLTKIFKDIASDNEN